MNPFDKYFGPEDRLHIACCDYLDLQYPKLLYTHPANEARRTVFERYKAKKLRMKAGVPDLLIFKPFINFVGLAVEFKIKGNIATKNQEEWHDRLIENKWSVRLIYNLDDFIKMINNCYGL